MMNIKAFARIVLIAFVGMSLVFFVRRQFISHNPLRPSSVPGASASLHSEKAAPQSSVAANTRVAAYYFHPHQRCSACRHVEAVAEQTIRRSFSDQLGRNEIVWCSIDVQEPANRHFASDYDIYWSTLVLVKFRDGSQVEYKNLKRAWQFQENDTALAGYVTAEVKSYLGEG